jgi:hypothetical protein
VRSDESFKDTYGDGYERKEAEPQSLAPDAAKNPGVDPAAQNDNEAKATKAALALAASDPRPLYVYRRLRNAKDLITWAKSQGFKTLVPANEMHVTVAYSRRAINWFSVPNFWRLDQVNIPEGGARVIGKLGDQGAVVLHFSYEELDRRNAEFSKAGASWDFPSYQPHLTLTYDAGDVDLDKIQPYTGELIFGPEIFEPLNEDWETDLQEIRFAESEERDEIDVIVSEMIAAQGWQPLSPQLRAVIDAIEQSESKDQLDEALVKGLSNADAQLLTQVIAQNGFALRIDAETKPMTEPVP